MKIRNLQTYLEGRCPGYSIEKLGTDFEPFLETIYGQDQKIDSTIKDIASFASNSEEQLFYEFVQNALDSGADTLCFHFDENYLIVLNNGEPFYTDPRHTGSEEKTRDGQLYNFLAKGKSLKSGDNTKSGEFGQGSKLLYTLILDKNCSSNRDQLLKSIKEEKKGPYIISWNNYDQLNNFRMQDAKWDYCDPHSGKNDLLIAKIMMTYFPITPGVDQELFSDEEFDDIRKAFERLVDPKSNINRLSRGTAIIVPLGSGQYGSISAKENLDRVKTRLGGFASITSDKERNHGRQLNHIYVGQEEVELHSVRSVFVDFTVDGQAFSYQFAFNPVFAKGNFVNIFKTLPVVQAKYRFGFIIDSQNFELDSSRQRINDAGKTSQQLDHAFRALLNKIKTIQKEDKGLFDYIYLSLIKSSPYKDNDDSKFICDPFYATFTPFLKENVKTTDGTYVPLDIIRKPVEGKVQFPLGELGIKSVRWINEDLKKGELKRYGLESKEYTLKEAISEADIDALKHWILTLDQEDYLKFQQEIYDIVKDDKNLDSLPLFRSNKYRVISLKETLDHSANVFFYSYAEGHSHLDRCPDIEYILGPIDYISEDGTSNNGTVNVMKVAANIDYFRSADSKTDAACHILMASMSYPRAKEAIRTKICLFKDLSGTYRPLCELFKTSPYGTKLYDPFRVIGYVPEIVSDGLFLSSYEDIWNWTVKHFDDICVVKDWDTWHQTYLKDLSSVFKAAGEPSDLISLYLDENGIPQTEKTFSLQNAGKLSSEEYDKIAMFAETQGYKLVPQRFDAILTEKPFNTEGVHMHEILEDGTIVDSELLRIVTKLYKEILYRFRIQPTDGGQFMISKVTPCKNYTCKVDCSEARLPLEKQGFYLIEDSVKRFFNSEFLNQFELTTQNGLMDDALSAIDSSHLLTLLPVVRIHNDAINRKFFNRIQCIEINSAISSDNPRWQVILYALEKTDPFYRIRLLELIHHNGSHLPSTIKSDKVKYKDTIYDLYRLMGEVKEANELVESFIRCLPNGSLFRSQFYAGNEETKSAEEVYKQLYNLYMNVYQLEFCLDYSLGETTNYNMLEIDSNTPLSEALEMISRRRFNGFDRYFSMDGYDSEVQVLADHNLLLDEEILPEDLENWLLKNPQNKMLMQNLMTSDESHIQFRKCLYEERSITPGSFVNDSGKLSRTTTWAISQNYALTCLSTRHEILSSLASAQSATTKPLAVIRATGQTIKNEDGELRLIFKFCYMDSHGSFMDHSSLICHERILTRYPQALRFFDEHLVYEYRDIEFLNAHGLMPMSRLAMITMAEKKEYPEFLNELYEKWKEMPESEMVRIFTSDSPVGTVLSIMEGRDKKTIFEMPTRNNLFGYDAEKKMVIIQYPNDEQMSEMKTLAKAAKEIDFFKNPFIVLQSLYVDMVENEKNPEAISGTSNKKAESLIQKLGADTVDKLTEKADTVKKLVESLTKEELQMVVDNKNKLQNLLEDMSTDNEDTPESKVRKMIGYIGEQVYKLYIERNGIDYEYSAAKGVGEYDFILPGRQGGPDTYVDVKTNLYTFVDSAVPFYIHKSQNRFMQLHPEANYRVVRISLTDINLKREYEHIRNFFGPDADVDSNPELKDRCDKIAENYWKAAKIKEFDAVSPEYGIKIEKKS